MTCFEDDYGRLVRTRRPVFHADCLVTGAAVAALFPLATTIPGKLEVAGVGGLVGFDAVTDNGLISPCAAVFAGLALAARLPSGAPV